MSNNVGRIVSLLGLLILAILLPLFTSVVVSILILGVAVAAHGMVFDHD